MPALAALACLVVTIVNAPAGRAETGRWLLAGGHLPACSSYASSACSTPVEWPHDAMHERRYRADPSALPAWAETARGTLSNEMIERVTGIVEQMSAQGNAAMPASEFSRVFRETKVRTKDGATVDGDAVYAVMPDRPWYALLDHLEHAPEDGSGRRLTEYVALDASESEAARSIYRRLVDMASRDTAGRPTVVVTTAASRNPYEALDYYSGVFRQAGAEVVWLPLDAAVRAARRAGECDRLERWQARVLGLHDRERVAPGRFDLQRRFCERPAAGPALLERADAVFLNGGDQSLTRAAFMDRDGRATPELETIRRRLAAGRLVLAGTSAGTAVQSSEVMVGNGSPESALMEGAIESEPPPRGCGRNGTCPGELGESSLTYTRGGIATFPVGVLDTHFSERWRQLRLIQLLVDTRQRFGIGIDETTALEAVRVADTSRFRFRAHGAGSVWLFDLGRARVTERRPLAVSGIRLTRIDDGGLVEFDALEGAAFDWPDPAWADDAEGPDCRRVSLDDRLRERWPATVEAPRCLQVDLDETGAVRLLLEPVAGGDDDEVSRFLASVRFSPGPGAAVDTVEVSGPRRSEADSPQPGGKSSTEPDPAGHGRIVTIRGLTEAGVLEPWN
jgi:cyanophycinase